MSYKPEFFVQEDDEDFPEDIPMDEDDTEYEDGQYGR
jgi:hypothetical protein